MTANRPEGHTPQAPAWTAVGLPEVTVYSMFFTRNPDSTSSASEMRAALTTGDDTPSHLERARVANEEVPTAVYLGYWDDPGAYRRWRERAEVIAAMSLPGVLEETATIPADRWETLHSTGEETPGVRNLSPVGPTDVHEYWGAARDRIPASADSDLAAEPAAPLPANLCLIRSGQIWQYCGDIERRLYFEQVVPNLTAGIEFLARNHDAGCLSSRFLHEQTLDGEDLESTSFVGWFRDLASLEAWSRSHPTHLAIFDSFLAMVGELGGQIQLRLWHEVSVLPVGSITLDGTDRSPLADL